MDVDLSQLRDTAISALLIVLVLAPLLRMQWETLKTLQKSQEHIADQGKQQITQNELLRKVVERSTDAEGLTAQRIESQSAKIDSVHNDVKAIPAAVTAAQTAIVTDLSKGFDATNEKVEANTKLVLEKIAPLAEKFEAFGEKLVDIKLAADAHSNAYVESEKNLMAKIDRVFTEFHAARTDIITAIKEAVKPVEVTEVAAAATPVAPPSTTTVEANAPKAL